MSDNNKAFTIKYLLALVLPFVFIVVLPVVISHYLALTLNALTVGLLVALSVLISHYIKKTLLRK